MNRTTRDRSQQPRDAEATPSSPPGTRTLLLSAVSAALLWGAMPPLNLWPLAWVAPVGWLVLVRHPVLAGRRPYLTIWITSFGYWLVLLQGLRLAHWATYFGWLALAFYVAFYLPVFIGLTRNAVHRLRVPLVLAAPMVWTGLELARGYLLTGFSIGLVAHSQVAWKELIQIADLGGAYSVTFVVIWVAAAVASAIPVDGRRTWWPFASACVLAAAVLAYGYVRLGAAAGAGSDSPSLKVALIQGSVDTAFGESPEYWVAAFERYLERTQEACRQHPDLDLVVWPESVFTGDLPEYTVQGTATPPSGVHLDPTVFNERLRELARLFQDKVRRTALATNSAGPAARTEPSRIHLLVAVESEVFQGDRIDVFNTALLIDPSGRIVDRYNKMHPVMCGEYLPGGSWFPWLYKLSPMAQGLSAGDRPRAFSVGGIALSPNICFESTVPHLIRRQVNELQRTGESVDVLVNLTNDGWFHGSSILDLHLVCGVFRAIENRRPMLIAANTGFSAWIDGSGVIRAQGARHAEDTLVIEAGPDARKSLYQRIGDAPAWFCLAFCLACAGIHFSARSAARK